MKDIEQLREKKCPQLNTLKMLSVAGMISIMLVLIAHFTRDQELKITALFAFTVLALSYQNLKQRRINKLLLEEIETLKKQQSAFSKPS